MATPVPMPLPTPARAADDDDENVDVNPHATAAPGALPRVVIRFCTQCRWMLRAAYYAQELLSTFALTLGEVALQPAAGGVFAISLVRTPPPSSPHDAAGAAATTPSASTTSTHLLWDRARDGGFPETKELKHRVRDLVEPSRSLGHVDRATPSAAGRDGGRQGPPAQVPTPASSSSKRERCEDCVT